MSLQQQKCSSLLESVKIPRYMIEEASLESLVENQRTLRRKLNKKDISSMIDKEKSNEIRLHMEALCHEMSELRELLPWKHWKQYPIDFKIDKEEAKFEVADMLCFLMNIAMMLDMDGNELFKYTYAKQKHNIERQEDPKFGYVK